MCVMVTHLPPGCVDSWLARWAGCAMRWPWEETPTMSVSHHPQTWSSCTFQVWTAALDGCLDIVRFVWCWCAGKVFVFTSPYCLEQSPLQSLIIMQTRLHLSDHLWNLASSSCPVDCVCACVLCGCVHVCVCVLVCLQVYRCTVCVYIVWTCVYGVWVGVCVYVWVPCGCECVTCKGGGGDLQLGSSSIHQQTYTRQCVYLPRQ